MTDVPHDRNAGSADEKISEANSKSVRKRAVVVAVDLGAESCRVSLLRWIDGQPEIQLVHRFANSARNDGNGLRWDLDAILSGVEEGLRGCAQVAPEGIAAIGVDGWAVDYVRIDPEGKSVADPFCYRDERTLEAFKQVHARISPRRLYELTGIQILPLNTLYQLHADPEQEQSLPWINVPEYLMKQFGGRRVSEYTNATHTQLLGVRDHGWCPKIFEAAGLDLRAAPPVVKPGTDIGQLAACEPVYETMPGWPSPTKGVRRFEDLPEAARRYIARLEEVSGVRAAIVSTGSERDDTIHRREILQLEDLSKTL